MKVIRNKIIPFGRNFLAINLFGIVFAKGECSAVILNHESIHTAQMRELGYIGFYIIYVIEWLARLAITRNRMLAYRDISFEREAYACQHDLSYLKKRPCFAQLSYIRKKRSRR